MSDSRYATDVKVEMSSESFEIRDKRFQIPGLVFRMRCPHCGAERVRAPDYLSYPTLNGREPVHATCEDADGNGCLKSFTFDLRLGLTVEALPSPEPPQEAHG